MRRVLPILFNTEMVRAILDGRKSCTRRIVKPQPQGKLCYRLAGSDYGTWGYPSKTAREIWGEAYKLPDNITKDELNKRWNPPYHTDDILYVRETWHKYTKRIGKGESCRLAEFYGYKASVANSEDAEEPWKPSIHMPKEAARIWLKVTNVRVERLQQITEAGIRKEGIEVDPKECVGKFDFISELFFLFQRLWDSTIKKSDLDCYGWDANPWVWVIEFERCEKPEGV